MTGASPPGAEALKGRALALLQKPIGELGEAMSARLHRDPGGLGFEPACESFQVRHSHRVREEGEERRVVGGIADEKDRLTLGSGVELE